MKWSLYNLFLWASYILTTKGHTKTYTVHTKTPKGLSKHKDKQKTTLSPYFVFSQSMKSIMDKELSPMNTPTHSKKLYLKGYLIT